MRLPKFPSRLLAAACTVLALTAHAADEAPLIGVTRLYTVDDGTTRFGEAAIPLALTDYSPPGPPILVTPRLPASDIAFASLPVGFVGDWHPAPRVQYALVLSGAMEIEAGDASKRVFEPGQPLLLEDIAGQGHRTRVVGARPVLLALVPRAE